MTETELRRLLDNRSDPEARGVLNDWRAQHGVREERLGVALIIDADAAADADADADADDADADDAADAADDADADADDAADAADAADDADADAAADDADADDADADAAAADADADADAAAARKTLHQLLTEEPEMRHGLAGVIVPGGYYGRGVWLVGWLHRVNGDEWELAPGNVTVWRRPGVQWIAGGFDQLCVKGLTDRYAASAPAEMPEQLHRLLVRRCKPADVKAFEKVCPRPAGWVEE